MKATLEFDLSLIDQEQEHLRCLKAFDMILVLDDIRESFRQHRKYGAPLITEERFFQLLEGRNINLDELS